MLQEFRERMRKEMKSQGDISPVEFKPTFKLSQLSDIEVDGIDTSDFPDFCDAFISRAGVETWDGEYRELNDDELEWINNECLDFVHEEVYKTLPNC